MRTLVFSPSLSSFFSSRPPFSLLPPFPPWASSSSSILRVRRRRRRVSARRGRPGAFASGVCSPGRRRSRGHVCGGLGAISCVRGHCGWLTWRRRVCEAACSMGGGMCGDGGWRWWWWWSITERDVAAFEPRLPDLGGRGPREPRST